MTLVVSDASGESKRVKERPIVSILNSDQFQDWDALVTRSPHGTVFHHSWWLEGTGADFDILGCWDENKKLVAGIPLPRKKRAGLVLYHSPRLTPYLGPIFDLTGANGCSEKLSRMRRDGERLAMAIEGFDSFLYTVPSIGPDLQGFLWAEFQAEMAYTFRFDASTTSENVWEQMVRTHRQKLKKQTQYVVESSDDIRALATLSSQTFERQGIACPFDENYLRALWSAVSKRGRANLYVAREPNGRPIAALFVVHDDRTSYQIVSGVDMNLPNCPAGYLLTWRAISDALGAGRAFDFEGSRVRGVEQYYRRWGAPAYPVWKLKKTGSLRGLLASAVFHGIYGAGHRRISHNSDTDAPHDTEETPRHSASTAGPKQPRA